MAQEPTIAQALDPTHPDSKPREGGVEEGIAICLSGGGYRAMLFHLGVLWRLDEVGLLRKAKRISSVSGGSITAGVLATRWNDDFSAVIAGVQEVASQTIDIVAGIQGLASLWSSIGDEVTKKLDKTLFKGATLQDLPDAPRFIFNATNVESGALWRFSKPYMGDWRVGRIKDPDIKLAVAVAASAAFPPFLSPVTLKLDPARFTSDSGNDLTADGYRKKVELTDGGVYDNLGIETAWKRYKTILVSDGGGKLEPDPDPADDWGRHSKRVLDLIDNQVRSLRKRQVIGSFQLAPENPMHRSGSYWGIRTNIADYGLTDALPCPLERTMELAGVATRLAAVEPALQDRLINWGYAVCDAAVRRFVDPTLPAPTRFPRPGDV